MEEVETANKRYWDNLMKNPPQQLYTRFSEIEEKYFNHLTKMFNIGEKDITERSQVEIAVNYMRENYANYLLSSLLEQFREAERTYFYYVKTMFSIKDKDITEQAREEKAIGYMKERYESYLLSLLEQYNEQKNNGPKK